MDRQKADLILLLEELTRKLLNLYDQSLVDKLGISYSEWRLLLSIYLTQANPTQENIAVNAGKSAAAVSRQLNLLEEMGLVERKFDKQSKRIKLVKLTRKGQNLFNKGLLPIGKQSRELMTYLGEDSGPFKECLVSLLNNLDKK